MVKAGIALVIGIAVIVALIKNSGDKKDSPTTQPAAAYQEPAARAAFEVVAAESSCEALPDEARVIFHVAVRNTGNGDGEVNMIPIRRYNDGTTNRSIMDTLTADIPAGQTRVLSGEFDYNALKHDLIECGARVVPGGGDVAISVS